MLKLTKEVRDTLHWLRDEQTTPFGPPGYPFVVETPLVMLARLFGLGSEGVDVFLNLEGRVFVCDWAAAAPDIHETPEARILAAGLRICARDNDLPELLSLIPQLQEPEPCPQCGGIGL